MRSPVLALVAAAAVTLAACSSESSTPATTVPVTTTPVTSTAATTVPDTTAAPTTTGAAGPDPQRPFSVFVPTGYEAATPMPLVVLLHGYGATGEIQEAYFKLQPLAEERGFLYVHPDGTVDARGKQFWNATDACCGFGDPAVDDSAYVMAIIDQVKADYSIDPKRVFLIGHSNGGFMSYRMACDHADVIAGIASLAGATFADPAACTPSEPVSVLQIHGTADATINYNGADIIGRPYPGAQTTAATWASYNECDPAVTTSDVALDLEPSIDGDESTQTGYDGCAAGTSVALWTIAGGAHIPSVSESMFPGVIDFLFAHPKS